MNIVLPGPRRTHNSMVILRKAVARLTESALDRFVARARRAAGLTGTVNVLVTTSRELRLLNRRFRGQDKPTDVLSFTPAFADKTFAGDLAISAEIAARNARDLGHPPATEIKILALHGVLHLAGYDHETDDGRMARREQRLRKQFGLPVALIERASEKISSSLPRPGRFNRPRKDSHSDLKSSGFERARHQPGREPPQIDAALAAEGEVLSSRRIFPQSLQSRLSPRQNSRTPRRLR
jgi:probable rRNA maturation factor